MPRTIRKELLDLSDASLRLLIRLDENIMHMDLRARGRQPAIDDYKAVIVEGHEQLRILWQALRDRL